MSRNLLEAAARGDVVKIEEQLAKRVDVNCTHKGTGRTPLIEAVISGQHAAAKSLIEAGANLNLFDKAVGYTALMWACSRGDLEAAKLLVLAGADVNARSPEFGWTPLLCAAGISLPVVQLLLEAGADPSVAKNDGTTAVAVAERAKHFEIAAELSAKGVTAQNVIPEPVFLPWPEIGVDVDYTNPASVVRGLIVAMNQYEERAHFAKDNNAILELMNDVYRRLCTDKKRPYGRNGSYSRPPEYDPATENLVASQEVRTGRAEVMTRSQTQGQREILYVLSKKAGRWLVDSRKSRLVGESDWQNDCI
jgi:ankyrin repeat protein